jgi:hypothetical protein
MAFQIGVDAPTLGLNCEGVTQHNTATSHLGQNFRTPAARCLFRILDRAAREERIVRHAQKLAISRILDGYW